MMAGMIVRTYVHVCVCLVVTVDHLNHKMSCDNFYNVKEKFPELNS